MSLYEGPLLLGDLAQLASEGHFDVILHGCNCQHAMGSGVALALSQRFPEILDADKQTRKDDPSKLGTYSHAVVKTERGSPLVILNAYTQRYYGKMHYQGPAFDMGALHRLCDAVLHRLGGRGLRFGYPLLGGDRGKADPYAVLQLLNSRFSGENHTLVYQPEPGRKIPSCLLPRIKKDRA